MILINNNERKEEKFFIPFVFPNICTKYFVYLNRETM